MRKSDKSREIIAYKVKAGLSEDEAILWYRCPGKQAFRFLDVSFREGGQGVEPRHKRKDAEKGGEGDAVSEAFPKAGGANEARPHRQWQDPGQLAGAPGAERTSSHPDQGDRLRRAHGGGLEARPVKVDYKGDRPRRAHGSSAEADGFLVTRQGQRLPPFATQAKFRVVADALDRGGQRTEVERFAPLFDVAAAPPQAQNQDWL